MMVSKRSDVDTLRRFEWSVVPASEVKVGDLIANQATVTDVWTGPCATTDRWRTTVEAGKTMWRCGEGLAWLGDSDRGMVVGRHFEAMNR